MSGLLAAASCERGVNPGTGALPSVPGKVSPTAFAHAAGAGSQTVIRALEAWERLADEGVVPHASDLRPQDVPIIPLPDNMEYPWSRYVERPDRNYAAERLRAVVNNIPAERIVAALPPARRVEVVRQVVTTDPAAVDAVLDDTEARIELNEGRFRQQERAAFNREARVVANGGRIPTPEEEARATASPLDAVYQADQAMLRAMSHVALAVGCIREAERLDREGHLSEPHREQVRQMALSLMATLDATTEVTR